MQNSLSRRWQNRSSPRVNYDKCKEVIWNVCVFVSVQWWIVVLIARRAKKKREYRYSEGRSCKSRSTHLRRRRGRPIYWIINCCKAAIVHSSSSTRTIYIYRIQVIINQVPLQFHIFSIAATHYYWGCPQDWPTISYQMGFKTGVSVCAECVTYDQFYWYAAYWFRDRIPWHMGKYSEKLTLTEETTPGPCGSGLLTTTR